MNDDARPLTDRLGELRASFDASFAAPAASERAAAVRLLAIRIGGDPYLVRLDQIDALERARRLVTLPSSPAVLLGLMGIRGALVPVFSLSRLVGHDRAADEPWVLFCGGGAPVGLAASGFEGYRELAAHDLVVNASDGRRYVTALAETEGVATGVIDVPRVLADIKGNAGLVSGRNV